MKNYKGNRVAMPWLGANGNNGMRRVNTGWGVEGRIENGILEEIDCSKHILKRIYENLLV